MLQLKMANPKVEFNTTAGNFTVEVFLPFLFIDVVHFITHDTIELSFIIISKKNYVLT